MLPFEGGIHKMWKRKLLICECSSSKFNLFHKIWRVISTSKKWVYLFFMRRTTPKKMMTKRRMPAMTPAIFTVWSVCFSGSTASGLWVAAPGRKKKKRIHRDQIKKMQLIRQNPNQIWRPFARGTWTKKSAQPHTSSALVIDVTLWRLINQWTDSVAFIYISTHSLALSCVYFEGSSLLIVHLLAATSAHCGSSCTGRDKCVLFLPLVNHVWGKWMLLL